jgi:Tfp pilus assembly protein PilZ
MERKKPIRRRFKRCTVRLLIDYWCEGRIGSDYATTLGAGGLFIESSEPWEAGIALTVRFRIPGDDALHVIPGRVAWVHQPKQDPSGARAPGMAIEFTDNAGSATLARALESWAEASAAQV